MARHIKRSENAFGYDTAARVKDFINKEYEDKAPILNKVSPETLAKLKEQRNAKKS